MATCTATAAGVRTGTAPHHPGRSLAARAALTPRRGTHAAAGVSGARTAAGACGARAGPAAATFAAASSSASTSASARGGEFEFRASNLALLLRRRRRRDASAAAAAAASDRGSTIVVRASSSSEPPDAAPASVPDGTGTGGGVLGTVRDYFKPLNGLWGKLIPMATMFYWMAFANGRGKRATRDGNTHRTERGGLSYYAAYPVFHPSPSTEPRGTPTFNTVQHLTPYLPYPKP